jgi:hypothetical protein
LRRARTSPKRTEDPNKWRNAAQRTILHYSLTAFSSSHVAPFAVTPSPDGWTPTPLPVLNGETHLIADFETGNERGKDGRCWWDGAFPVGLAWFLPQSGRRGYTGVRHTDGNATDPATLVRWLNDLRNMHIDNAQTKFDLHISRENGADLCDRRGHTFGDVQHRAALLDDNRYLFGIDKLAQDFLGPDRGKVVLPFDKGRMADVPAWMVDAYAVEDVVLVERPRPRHRPADR